MTAEPENCMHIILLRFSNAGDATISMLMLKTLLSDADKTFETFYLVTEASSYCLVQRIILEVFADYV